MIRIRYPEDLPITARREEIVAAIRGNQVVILAGETGSGKTTQLPKMCLEAAGEELRGKIGCTQPRRVAAMSVSRRVAEELAVPWGGLVGCKMRFNDDTSRETRVKFMTDGILLAEIQGDPTLRSYSMLILDEAHERSLNIDFLLGYLKGLLARRPDLKLLVTSATIDTEAFSQHFGGAPIIEVSGRLYPVEIRHAPVAEDDDDLGMIEAAVGAVEDALIETNDGDVLVFMPTERDIREARELLEGRLGSGYEVLALFGRMPAAEQQRIFAPGPKRRVVVATNVAETSITIPRIRYVIDTGLARVSRYNPRTRTKRLPVEPVSQSSANQRAGRAGRVQDGVCIRLYTQEDFEKRPRFSTPEIQRANLAEVILRMKAFRLGEIESFPFINPPTQASIRGGYELLHELGALGDTHDMTPVGRELARLPVDPTLGRMLLQAKQEGTLPEMLVIAAGLSVPDPRERPEEAKEQAAAAHKAFASPDSDFLSLLRIWRAAPEPDAGSRNALRRFCKASFLSMTRMREWRDIWRQLREALGDADESTAPPDAKAASNDDAIHRSILAGLLGHIAMREERNTYKAAGNRQVMIFPGSNLYDRKARQHKPAGGPNAQAEKVRQPQWIMAGEIVQTSQLFARMVARIDPAWIPVLGAHLCQFRHSEPHYNAKTGRVLVTQRTFVHGLEVARQHVDFGKVDPVAATQIYIREALVGGEALPQHRFVAHNRKLREKIETTLTRVRSARAWDIEERLQRYYEARIHGVSSVHDLNRFVQEHGRGKPDFLCASEEDLTGGDELAEDLALFPDQVPLGNSVLPLSYAYNPGEDTDGVTIQVPLPLAEHLTTAQVQWLVPGMREELASVLLRALPKAMRRPLMPLEPKAREIANEFQPGAGDFLAALAAFITRRYHVAVQAGDWPPQSLPAHLQPRIEVVDQDRRTVTAGRDLEVIRASVKKKEVRSDAWDRMVKHVERYAVSTWSFGDLPESVVVEEINGVPVPGYPGLAFREGEVDVRLFRKKEDVLKGSARAVRKLAEQALGKDIAWLQQELRSLSAAGAKPAKPASFQDALSRLSVAAPAKGAADKQPRPAAPLADQAREHILAHALRLEPLAPLTEARFRAMCEAARKEFPTLAYRVRDLLKQIEASRDKILAGSKRYPGLEADLQRLVPPDLLACTPHAQLQHVPRYLRAVEIRAERAALSPAKDEGKAAQVEDFDGWDQEVSGEHREAFRWMLEEFRVSIFAPELGTAQKVSAKRLEELLAC